MINWTKQLSDRLTFCLMKAGRLHPALQQPRTSDVGLDDGRKRVTSRMTIRQAGPQSCMENYGTKDRPERTRALAKAIDHCRALWEVFWLVQIPTHQLRCLQLPHEGRARGSLNWVGPVHVE